MSIRACLLMWVGACCVGAAHAAQWNILEDRSELKFELEIAGAKAIGTFPDWDAAIDYDPAMPHKGTVSATIFVESATIDREDAQSTLTKQSWLDSDNHPTARFVAQGFELKDDNKFTLPGELTLRGQKMPVILAGELEINGARACAKATTVLARTDFGIGQESDPASIDVHIQLQITAERLNN